MRCLSITEAQKELIAQVLHNLEHKNQIWDQGWFTIGIPMSYQSGGPYYGYNQFALEMAANREKYRDNRWLTYNQIKKNGYKFKLGPDGVPLAKGKGVTVEFFEFRDRRTGMNFNFGPCQGMPEKYRKEYFSRYLDTKYSKYTVYNADLIEGVKERNLIPMTFKEQVETAERVLFYWNKYFAKIVYGGNDAYYEKETDTIHIPHRYKFKNAGEFYQTVFHEIAHSTSAPGRYRRELYGPENRREYAKEELRAELSAMFIQQQLGIELTSYTVANNSMYIKSWISAIKEDPEFLLEAVTDAQKICRFVNMHAASYKVEEVSIEEIRAAVHELDLARQGINEDGSARSDIIPVGADLSQPQFTLSRPVADIKDAVSGGIMGVHGELNIITEPLNVKETGSKIINEQAEVNGHAEARDEHKDKTITMEETVTETIPPSQKESKAGIVKAENNEASEKKETEETEEKNKDLLDLIKEYESEEREAALNSEADKITVSTDITGNNAVAEGKASGEETIPFLKREDWEVIKQLQTVTTHNMFNRLYNGESYTGNMEKDKELLVYRICMYSSDPEQIKRIYLNSKIASSGDSARLDKLISEGIKLSDVIRKTMRKDAGNMASYKFNDK